jgi:LPS O-antigen subunit length determinant protein (WzzB/FepE family)
MNGFPGPFLGGFMHSQPDNAMLVQKQAAVTNSSKEKKWDYLEREVNLFDILFSLQKSWRIILGFLVISLIASLALAYKITFSYQISIPLTLASEKTLEVFYLPRLNLNSEGTLFIPETSMITRDELLRVIKRQLSHAFAESVDSLGVLTDNIEDGQSANISLKWSKRDAKSVLSTLPQELDQASEQAKADIQRDIARKMERRLDQIEAARRILRQSTVQSTNNRIAVREREIEYKKESLKSKIKSMEYESLLRRESELGAIEEKRQAQRYEIERRLEALHKLAAARREDRIAELKQAFKIAEQLNIDEMERNRQRDARIDARVDDLLYLRGKKFLEAEIKQLQEQTNNSILVPEIRELEQGLKLIENDSRYFALQSRKNDRLFSTEIPALEAQLKLLDNDEELIQLRTMIKDPGSLDLYTKEFQLLNTDMLRIDHLKAVLAGYQFFSHGSPAVSHQSTRAVGVIVGGVFLGLILGCVAALILEGWKAYSRDKRLPV